MKITVTHDDGTTADITEGVRVAYDIAYNSMDWGSGFLDLEEMDAVAKLADACRFPSYQEAYQSVQDAREAQERAQRYAEENRKRREEQDRIARERYAQQQTEQARRLRMMTQGWLLPTGQCTTSREVLGAQIDPIWNDGDGGDHDTTEGRE